MQVTSISLVSMNSSFLAQFPEGRPILIGAVHLPPSPGFEGFPGFDVAEKNAVADAQALQEGGASAIIFENNYDLPHTANVTPEVTEAMIRVGAAIQAAVSIPVGASVLWNDYTSALKIAKALGLTFIRVPVFVDSVRTSYGDMHGDAEAVLRVRKELGVEHVSLLTDIHVKHAELLTKETIEQTALRAIAAGSEALIITGKWTGDAPNVEELSRLRDAVGTFPILCGSGVSDINARALFALADGAIVSTSLKEESDTSHDVNVKPYDARISSEKTHILVQASRK